MHPFVDKGYLTPCFFDFFIFRPEIFHKLAIKGCWLSMLNSRGLNLVYIEAIYSLFFTIYDLSSHLSVTVGLLL